MVLVLGGQVVGESDFNENPVVSLHLDLDFGLRLRVCQFLFKSKFLGFVEAPVGVFYL